MYKNCVTKTSLYRSCIELVDLPKKLLILSMHTWISWPGNRHRPKAWQRAWAEIWKECESSIDEWKIWCVIWRKTWHALIVLYHISLVLFLLVLCCWDVRIWCCLWLKTKQKRELVGKTERTTSDRLHERRLKKRRQKTQRLQKEKREKDKAEKTAARLGSMKNLMDAVAATSKQEVKNKKKTHQSVSKRNLVFISVKLTNLLFSLSVVCTDLLIPLINKA